MALAARYGGRAVGFDELPGALEAADIVVAATASPHAIVGPRELGAGHGGARGPAAADHRPRGAARHRPGLRGPARRHPLRHRRPSGRDRTQPARAQGRGPPRRGDHRGGDPALRRPGSARWTWCRRSRRCARAPTRSSTRSCARTTSRGSRSAARPRARSRRSRARSSRAAARADGAAQAQRGDRAHARCRLLRELFGLEGDEDSVSSCRRSSELLPPVEVELCAAALMRIGTRGQRAGARAGAGGGGARSAATPRSSRSAPGATAAREIGDKSRWVRELERALLDGRDRPRRALGQGRSGRACRGARAAARAARGRTRATRSAAPARLPRCRPARASGRAACGGGPIRAGRGGPRGRRPCAATWTRGCASSPRASPTRWCSRSRACAARPRRRGRRVLDRARARGRPGRARARGPRRSDPPSRGGGCPTPTRPRA